ncbi:hypothetical protein BJF81_10800 [Ornithinimicrobium sp. CNJ-824]|nr:hypothetical protein BJF81_10800 [Ornithinimicrobium sp. CNJ-824]
MRREIPAPSATWSTVISATGWRRRSAWREPATASRVRTLFSSRRPVDGSTVPRGGAVGSVTRSG